MSVSASTLLLFSYRALASAKYARLRQLLLLARSSQTPQSRSTCLRTVAAKQGLQAAVKEVGTASLNRDCPRDESTNVLFFAEFRSGRKYAKMSLPRNWADAWAHAARLLSIVFQGCSNR